MSGPNTTGRGVAAAESPLLWHMVRLFVEYHKNSVDPLSGIGAWRLRKWVCVMVPRD